MTAIYRRELGSYYRSIIGYVLSAIVLASIGYGVATANLNSGSANFEYVLNNIIMVIILMVVIPVLTMRIIAEERRQRTDQLLYSLPTTMTKVVLGKYLAAVTVLALPLAVVAVYPLILGTFGRINYGIAYGNLLAFFLLCCALVSMGLFASSLTESQILAAVLCFFVLFVNFMMPMLAAAVPKDALTALVALVLCLLLLGLILWLLTRNTVISITFTAVCEAALLVFYLLSKDSFAGLFTRVIDALSLFSRLDSFYFGVFDLVNVVYYLVVSAVFIFLTVQVMEKRRWS